MKAEEKFLERIKNENLIADWDGYGKIGKVENDRPIVFIHENATDKFSEIHYAPFNEMRCDERFRKKALSHFSDIFSEDDARFKEVYEWLYKDKKCPLEATDIYFIGDSFITYYRDFRDDDDDSKLSQSFDVQTRIGLITTLISTDPNFRFKIHKWLEDLVDESYSLHKLELIDKIKEVLK